MFLTIYNNCTEDIELEYQEKRDSIKSKSTHMIETQSIEDVIVGIYHVENFAGDAGAFSERFLNSMINLSTLIIDCHFQISSAIEDVFVEIRNATYSWEQEDVVLLFFEIKCDNAQVKLGGCKPRNVENFLKKRKALLIADANDFPPISIITSLVKMKKIKRFCDCQNIFDVISKSF